MTHFEILDVQPMLVLCSLVVDDKMGTRYLGEFSIVVDTIVTPRGTILDLCLAAAIALADLETTPLVGVTVAVPR